MLKVTFGDKSMETPPDPKTPKPPKAPTGWPSALASVVHSICGAAVLIILILCIAKGCTGQPITIP